MPRAASALLRIKARGHRDLVTGLAKIQRIIHDPEPKTAFS
jgi:hypothetical protein